MHRPAIHRPRWLGTITVTAIALSLALFSAGAASAANNPAGTGIPRASSVTVPAQLTLDCTGMSAQAHQYAVAHGYCPASGPAASGTAIPDSRGTTPPGDCGTSWIQIDNLGGGTARFTWGFNSTLGAVAYRNLAVNWVNELFTNDYGGWPDSGVMLSSSYTSPARNVGTGEGDVFGDAAGYVVLWWGGSCDLLVPETTQYIS